MGWLANPTGKEAMGCVGRLSRRDASEGRTCNDSLEVA